MSKLKNTLNFALELPSDLINIIHCYTQSKEYKKINEFKHINDKTIKHGFINIGTINDTATLEKNQIIHKTSLTDIKTYIYMHWFSTSVNLHVVCDYKYIMHTETKALFPFPVDVLKDTCLTKEYKCFLLIYNNKPRLHLKTKTMLHKSCILAEFKLNFTPDHLFVIPNQTPETLALIKEETALNPAELLLFSMTDLKFIETSSKIIKSNIIYVLDFDTNIETDFYFSTSDNTTTYLGSKTYLVTKTEKFNAIFILNSPKRHLCVLRETHLELYEEYLSYD